MKNKTSTKDKIGWVPRSEKPSDKLVFDFKSFFREADHTLEEVAQILNYSVSGVKKMIIRGTIKRSAYDKIKRSLALDISQFIKKGVKNGS